MFAIRFALFIGFLYGYHVIALEGPGMCPHGGHGSSVTSDQGGGLDPDGRIHGAGVTPDAGPRIDPEG
jgi:hypothetical protein